MATSSEEARKLLSENIYNVVLLDILLTDINGVILRKEILALGPLLPVIFQNGYAQYEKIEKLTRPTLMQIA